MDFEKELDRIAQQYRDEGYLVVTHPDQDHLPGFATAFGADLLAKRGDGNILVRVKRDRADLEADPNVPMQAGITNMQPGWHYDLVVLNESDPLRRLTRGSREPSPEEIKAMLADVERLLKERFVPAACVLAWAALEAAMRQVASATEGALPRPMSRELLRALYGNGILSRDQFHLLDHVYRLRTEIVHGLIPPTLDAAVVQPVVEATRHLLNGHPNGKKVAT